MARGKSGNGEKENAKNGTAQLLKDLTAIGKGHREFLKQQEAVADNAVAYINSMLEIITCPDVKGNTLIGAVEMITSGPVGIMEALADDRLLVRVYDSIFVAAGSNDGLIARQRLVDALLYLVFDTRVPMDTEVFIDKLVQLSEKIDDKDTLETMEIIRKKVEGEYDEGDLKDGSDILFDLFDQISRITLKTPADKIEEARRLLLANLVARKGEDLAVDDAERDEICCIVMQLACRLWDAWPADVLAFVYTQLKEVREDDDRWDDDMALSFIDDFLHNKTLSFEEWRIERHLPCGGYRVTSAQYRQANDKPKAIPVDLCLFGRSVRPSDIIGEMFSGAGPFHRFMDMMDNLEIPRR